MPTKFIDHINKDITFVFQGPIINEDDATKKSFISVRKYFPDSKIILSTWKNSNFDNLDFDEKIETQDPGAENYLYKNQKSFNNGNRMILSSYNGLINVKTKFAIKLRTDMYMQSNNLINLFKILDKSNSNYSKKKIIIPSNMAFNPDRSVKLLFHPSDNFFAGLTEDLLDLFNIPLMDNNHMKYFENKKSENSLQLIQRYTCEQYLFYSFIKKKVKINFDNAFDYNDINKSMHDKIFSNLFIMYRNTKIGFNHFKYPMNFFSDTLYPAYTEHEFNKLTNNHSFFDFERLISNISKYLKLMILSISKNLYYKIKNYFIKNWI